MENTKINLLDTVMEMFRGAAVFTVDDSPILKSVETSEVTGSPDNQIVYLSWTNDEGLGFAVKLTEEGISNGKWVDGQFHCNDHEGEPTVITFFQLDKLYPCLG